MADILFLYLALYVSAFLHETLHVVAAKGLGIPVVCVKIGNSWPQIKIGSWRISPLIGISYVETEQDSIERLSFSGKALFFLSGIGANIILAGCFGLLYRLTGEVPFEVASLVNLIMVIANGWPMGPTDVAKLIRLKTKK